MSRFVLSLLVTLLSFAAFAADDPFAKELAAQRNDQFYCFDGSEQFHDPIIDICGALKENTSADATTRSIAKRLGVSEETARELAMAALPVFEAGNSGATDELDVKLRDAQERLIARLAREPKREPVLFVLANVASAMKSRREAFEMLRQLLRDETDPSAAIEFGEGRAIR